MTLADAAHRRAWVPGGVRDGLEGRSFPACGRWSDPAELSEERRPSVCRGSARARSTRDSFADARFLRAANCEQSGIPFPARDPAASPRLAAY